MTRRRPALLALSALAIFTPALSSCATAVPMGGGYNFLGTSDNNDNGASLVGTISSSLRENFWLSIGGYCQRREYGDLITAYADNNGANTGAGHANDNPATSCQPADEGGPEYVRHNPGYDPAGYHYLVTIPAGYTGTKAIQVYDPGFCPGSGYPDGSSATGQRTTFSLAGPTDVFNPFVVRTWDPDGGEGVDISSCTVGTTTGTRAWYTLATVTEPGSYVITVTAPAPLSRTTREGNNQFGLRVGLANNFVACANQSALAPVGSGVSFMANCPTITSMGAMGMYTDLTGTTPTFRLGAVPAGSDGKTFHVELFDAAEGQQYIELLDPTMSTSSPAGVTFTAEVSCQDGTYQSETGIDCPTATGETPPTPVSGSTYGPWTTNKIDICGPKPACGAYAEGGSSSTADAAAQPWGFQHLVQRTQYSNRTVRLSVTLPADLAAAYGPKSMWHLRYTSPGAGALDRSTWKASIA